MTVLMSVCLSRRLRVVSYNSSIVTRYCCRFAVLSCARVLGVFLSAAVVTFLEERSPPIRIPHHNKQTHELAQYHGDVWRHLQPRREGISDGDRILEKHVLTHHHPEKDVPSTRVSQFVLLCFTTNVLRRALARDHQKIVCGSVCVRPIYALTLGVSDIIFVVMFFVLKCTCVDVACVETNVSGGATKDPPKNTRAAGLLSFDRERREENRKKDEAAAFERERLEFERERAKVLQGRDG